MSLTPLQAVPVRRTPPGIQTARGADHSAWVCTDVPIEDAGANQSFVRATLIPFEDAGAEQSFMMSWVYPFEDAGAEQSLQWMRHNDPFEG